MNPESEIDQKSSAIHWRTILGRFLRWIGRLLISKPNTLVVLIIAGLTSFASPLLLDDIISPEAQMKYDIVHRSHPGRMEHFTVTVRNTGTAVIPKESAELKLQFKSDITNIKWLIKPVRGTTNEYCMGKNGQIIYYSLLFGSFSPKGILKLRIYAKDVLHTEPSLSHAGKPHGMGFCNAEGNFKKEICGGLLASSDFADDLAMMQCPKTD